jgi:ribonuclease P protein component
MRGDRARLTLGRLTKRPDFVAAASGRRFHTERMTVQGRLRGEDALGLRFGLTVTKKVGHATERNRIKRRLRAAIQSAAADYAALDVDVVVIGRRDILAADFDGLINDLRRALKAVTKPRVAAPNGRPPRSPAASPSTDGDRRGTPHA